MVVNVAHRGASGNYPENTLLAFQKALEIGVDEIELDLYLTKDDHLIIMHDPTVDRTTDGTGAISDLTLTEIKLSTLEEYLVNSFGASACRHGKKR